MAIGALEKAETLKFRYSNRFFFYLIWMGGFLALGLLVYFKGDALSQVAYAAIDSYGTAGFVASLCFIVVYFVLSFIVPFAIARRVTDRRGTAHFYRDHAEIRMGLRTLKIAYRDIKRLKYRTILNAQHGGTGVGPMLYRLHIKTQRGKYILPRSFKEAWECKKASDVPPSIDALLGQFSARTDLDVKLVAR